MLALESPSRVALPASPTRTNSGNLGSPAEKGPTATHRALVAYGSRFGNTQRIAEALANGLRRSPGNEVDCRGIEEVDSATLRRYELVAVGGPTEIASASKPMKEFFGRLPAGAMTGLRGFAFDTRFDSRLAGSAGAYIERHLKRLGAEIVYPHASATVRGMTKEERAAHGAEGAPEWVRRLDKSAPSEPAPKAHPVDLLAPGAVAEFEEIGAQLGALLVAAPR
jgi:menaquinone-dependent protoporphyrinogen IX oxidase